MTLDFLEATDEHYISIKDAEEHGQYLVDFLEALRDVHIIRGVWAAHVYKRQLGGVDMNIYEGMHLRIDSRPWQSE